MVVLGVVRESRGRVAEGARDSGEQNRLDFSAVTLASPPPLRLQSQPRRHLASPPPPPVRIRRLLLARLSRRHHRERERERGGERTSPPPRLLRRRSGSATPPCSALPTAPQRKRERERERLFPSPVSSAPLAARRLPEVRERENDVAHLLPRPPRHRPPPVVPFPLSAAGPHTLAACPRAATLPAARSRTPEREEGRGKRSTDR